MNTLGTRLSPEHARALLSRVSHADRLDAGRLQPPVGLLPGSVRSVAELHMLLTPEPRGIPAVNLDALVTWVRLVIGDERLATELGDACAASTCYADACRAAYRLVGTRLEQARLLLDEGRGR